MMNNKDFAVFILTHGRADAMYTDKTLRRCGYTGEIYYIIDNEDETAQEYFDRFGKDRVIVFDKVAEQAETDVFDDLKHRQAVVYARNANFRIAKELGITYFLQLDDDYTAFDYRCYVDEVACVKPVKDLDAVFDYTLNYFKSLPENIRSIAYAQGGDFIGGLAAWKGLFKVSKRKLMNTFFCSVDRPFKFLGRINEDVNVYTSLQSRGDVFLTIQNLSITQRTTQKNKGGLTNIYLSLGTYVKSFYSVICSPSSVKVKMMHTSHKRLHHSVNWPVAVPQIIDEKHRKK